MILSALCLPDFVIPRDLCTLYRCSLTNNSPRQTIPWNTMNRDYCNHCHKGNCTLVRQYLTIAVGIISSCVVRVSTRQLAVSSLSKGISNTFNFHKSIVTDRTWTHYLLHRKQALYQLTALPLLLLNDIILLYTVDSNGNNNYFLSVLLYSSYKMILHCYLYCRWLNFRSDYIFCLWVCVHKPEINRKHYRFYRCIVYATIS